MSEGKILVSACLCGVECRYDGAGKYDERIAKLVKEGKAIMVCPEQLGGLSTPRIPAEGQTNGHMITKKGDDVTAEYEKGAQEALKIAQLSGATTAILKSKSPMCGCGQIYDGSFSGTQKEGDGVLTKLLKKNNISVKTENDM